MGDLLVVRRPREKLRPRTQRRGRPALHSRSSTGRCSRTSIAGKTEAVEDALGFFRTTIELTDTSLLEVGGLLHPKLWCGGGEREKAVEAIWVRELVENPRSLAARVRSEMHLLVTTWRARRGEEAAEQVVEPPAMPRAATSGRAADGEGARAILPGGDRCSTAREPAPSVDADPAIGDRQWEVQQTLLDPERTTCGGSARASTCAARPSSAAPASRRDRQVETDPERSECAGFRLAPASAARA
ncbi:MAG: hypothetical protein R2862_08170 [Thermoanaerobaculia bacterium]